MNSVIRTAGIGFVLVAAVNLAAHADDKAKPVEGAWRQVEHKNGDAHEYTKTPDGTEIIELIVGGRFVWTVVQNGKVVSIAGGRYQSEKDKFTEIIEYVSGEAFPESFVGSKFEFTMKVDGDTLSKVGTIKLNARDFKIDEKSERCKP
jgi:hypothetical protein